MTSSSSAWTAILLWLAMGLAPGVLPVAADDPLEPAGRSVETATATPREGQATEGSLAADRSAQLAQLPLLELRGDLTPVRYTAGSLQRASQIQDSFELLAADFAGWSGHKERLPVVLLSRDEWEDVGFGLPYGLAARAHGSSVAVAAWGDAETVQLWGRLLGWDLPTVEDVPLRNTADEAGSLVGADLLALFEGARVLTEKARYKGSERWIGDLVAHTVAISVIARLPAGGLRQAESLYGRLGASRAGGPRPLSSYGAGLTVEDWLWYQARFFEGARLILEQERRGAGKSIVRLARRGGSITRGDLVGRYPALGRWLADGFAAESR